MQKAKKLTMSKKASTGVTPQKQSQEAMNITAKIGSCTLQVPQKDDVKSIINPRITDVVKGVNYFKPGLPKKVVVAPPTPCPMRSTARRTRKRPKRSSAPGASMRWRRMPAKWRSKRRSRGRNARGRQVRS